MGILDSIERGLERAVNGVFVRTFRSGVQPVEIAAGLKRELEIGSVVVDRDRVLAPNHFVVRIAEADAYRLGRMGARSKASSSASCESTQSARATSCLATPMLSCAAMPPSRQACCRSMLRRSKARLHGLRCWKATAPGTRCAKVSRLSAAAVTQTFASLTVPPLASTCR